MRKNHLVLFASATIKDYLNWFISADKPWLRYRNLREFPGMECSLRNHIRSNWVTWNTQCLPYPHLHLQEDVTWPSSKGINGKTKSINWISYSCFDISRRLVIRTRKHWYDAQHYALHLHIVQPVKFDNREVECWRKNSRRQMNFSRTNMSNNHKGNTIPILKNEEKYTGHLLDQDLEHGNVKKRQKKGHDLHRCEPHVRILVLIRAGSSKVVLF